jgi:aspartate kinase
VVQKYGGSSVADVSRIGKVADRVAATRKAGKDLVVVVSAMGDTTDELLALAHQVTPEPSRRELDMLLSAGERISMALLSMALQARGVAAVSFTGSQSGIITSDAHANARIVEVRPFRVQDELARNKVVIVAGYQGVSYRKEVTTLGRGGSDTTAVALAAALDAEACEIYSDVEGVYSADPRVVPAARRLSEVSYEEMQELAQAGAKVLNAQAVEFAKERGIALYARSSFGGPGETVVRRFPPRAPGRVAGVASETGLVLVETAPGKGATHSLEDLLTCLDDRGAAGKQLHVENREGSGFASVVLSLENLHDFGSLRDELTRKGFHLREGVSAVSAIGTGVNASFRNVRTTLETLAELGAPVLGLSTSSFRISVLLEQRLEKDALRRLHERLVESDPVLAP